MGGVRLCKSHQIGDFRDPKKAKQAEKISNFFFLTPELGCAHRLPSLKKFTCTKVDDTKIDR